MELRFAVWKQMDRMQIDAKISSHAVRVSPSALRLVLLCYTILFAFLLCPPSMRGQQKPYVPDFNLALTGDSIIMTPTSIHQSEPQFMALVNSVRQSDAAFTNLEE